MTPTHLLTSLASLSAPTLLPAALEPGDVRGIVWSILATVVGVVALVLGGRQLRTWVAGGPVHRQWPTVEGVVVGTTGRPRAFTGEQRVTEGARYRVVRHPDQDGVQTETAVPPAVRRPHPSGAPVTLHVDPSGRSTPVAAHSLLPRIVALLALGVVLLGGVLVHWFF
ncbi:hypothetical protein ENKNEFLB_00961 [Nocardioides aquaticus]|uniref:DUF3592 domain-containing protein n=1 Tax=Nocardioides aquaticus TaxID=160826 RepID=A0ABX8EDM8_9ACTN|nr:DUF3592 domain-containing protein [Nocardioides aquaticus]QVT78583.1 hypothetical protein ENKNEFLB_00961 [Nocardioides aquaticus]